MNSVPRKSTIVLITVGGHGTTLPLVSLGKYLIKHGHRVVLISHAPYKAVAEQSGVVHESISSNDEYHRSITDKPLTYGRYRDLFVVRHSAQWNSAIFRILERYTAERPIVLSVARANLWADAVARYRLRLPLCRLYFDLPDAVRADTANALPLTRTHDRLAWRAAAQWHDEANTSCGTGGISQLLRVRTRPRGIVGSVALWPRWITGKYPVTSIYDHYLGFISPPPMPLQEGLKSWIKSLARPLVLFVSGTLGTTRQWERQFVKESFNACANSRSAGLILGAERGVDGYNRQWFRSEPFAPLDQLLPAAGVIVHHGGIGTAASAIRSRVPQIIVPRVFGQISNAEWMRRLNVASLVSPNDYRSSTMSGWITKMLMEPAPSQSIATIMTGECEIALEAFERFLCTMREVFQ